MFRLSRRKFLAASALTAACGRRKAAPFQGFCFVANQAGRSVGVVDLVRFRFRKEIKLDGAPTAVVTTPGNPKVFVLSAENGTVYEIDPVAHNVTRRARAGNHAVAMQLAPANDALWVLYNDPPALVELPFDTFRPRGRVTLPAAPTGFDLSRDGDAAIALPSERHILDVSPKGGETRTLSLDVDPSLVRFRQDGRHLIVASHSERMLTLVDRARSKVSVKLPLPLSPRNLCFNSDGGQLFVSGDGLDGVVHIYPYRTEVAETMLAGRAPGAMAVLNGQTVASETVPPLPYLLVTNPESDTVTVLDYDSPGTKLVSVVHVGRGPCQIVVTPDDQYALVINESSGDMAVIRMASLSQYPNGSKRRYQVAPLFTVIPVGERPVSAGIVRFA